MDDAGRAAQALAAARRRIAEGEAAGPRFRALERLVAALPGTVRVARLPRRVRRAFGGRPGDVTGALGAAAVREAEALRALAGAARGAGEAEARAAVREARRHHAETLAGLSRVLAGLEAGIRARDAEAAAGVRVLGRRARALQRALRRGRDAAAQALRAYSSQRTACLAAQAARRAALARLADADAPALLARLDALDRETAAALRRALLLAGANGLARPAALLAQAQAALGTLAPPPPAPPDAPPSTGAPAPDALDARLEAARPSAADTARLRALGLLPATPPASPPASAPPAERGVAGR